MLTALGVDDVCDWANDDQPYLIGRTDRPLVSLPCHGFDTLYREGEASGRRFVLPLHPWCIGQPFRVRYLGTLRLSALGTPRRLARDDVSAVRGQVDRG